VKLMLDPLTFEQECALIKSGSQVMCKCLLWCSLLGVH